MNREVTAIYVLWLREMKRFFRAKSRVVGTLGMPLFFMAFLGFGFRTSTVPGIPEGIDYITYLVPGIVGMTLLFSSTFAGISVLWDREFGFLKEIMVAPVSRISIVLGRTAGGATTSLLQGVLILLLSGLMGFSYPGFFAFLAAALFMLLISTTFISMGLIFASNMKDIHGFTLVMNFVVFPIFFLSGALFPVENLPLWVQPLSYADPLTYGVDGLRGVLTGVSSFPLMTDAVILTGFFLLLLALGAWSFERSEST
ncbi:ABC-2 type transport system permease protein [Methanofollis sp. W23]|uniref:ABC transporter permease n=1 Tax=Methanofollis sp. W23 TaxID=2817849 RepID=UPI001AE138E4|nr:ABC transporter permease [Methanofollis sp. W23]MBP2146585.1 ABC-2 type transport system permease protein [Methanofollis sp. W23]